MCQEIPVLVLTRTASAAITGKRFVGFDNAQATAGANVLGVSQYGVIAGQDFPVTVIGTAAVEVGAAITDGQELEADAQGRAVPKTTGKTVARALASATAAGQFVEAFLIGN